MIVMWRWMTGAAVGFELNPSEKVYISIYFFIVEIVFADKSVEEDFE
jgi:hypothetical protein